jgi:hypothetical protein
MISIIIVNIWRGVPFFAISLLPACRPSAPSSEAAAIDAPSPGSGLAPPLAAAAAGHHGGRCSR